MRRHYLAYFLFLRHWVYVVLGIKSVLKDGRLAFYQLGIPSPDLSVMTFVTPLPPCAGSIAPSPGFCESFLGGKGTPGREESGFLCAQQPLCARSLPRILSRTAKQGGDMGSEPAEIAGNRGPRKQNGTPSFILTKAKARPCS